METLAPRGASGCAYVAGAALAGAGAPHGHGGTAVREASLLAWKEDGSGDAARWGRSRKEEENDSSGWAVHGDRKEVGRGRKELGPSRQGYFPF